MNRENAIERLQSETFDIAIVGGGATGVGCALDAASRGYRTALVEAGDFAQSTSSRSTKLIHGGIRYLRQGNVALVREALRERGNLLRNAPGYVTPLPFFVPVRGFERALYAGGFFLYDSLATGNTLPRAHAERDGIVYYDAQFDDARLALAIVQTAWEAGAATANYVRVTNLTRACDVHVVGARDEETGRAFDIRARAVINAAGIFADEIRMLDDPRAAPMLRFSRGTHIVVAPETLDGNGRALLVPKTSDGRVLFAIPWQGMTVIGTTDVPVERAEIDPSPTADEVDWLLAAIRPYARTEIRRTDVTSCFAGLRPLVSRAAARSAQLSREHAVVTSPNGLVSILGGKWTTYRKMAEDTVDAAVRAANLSSAPCRTERLRLVELQAAHSVSDYARNEMARTVSDVLARRERTLFLNARTAIDRAPSVAAELGEALGRDGAWQSAQAQRFSEAARQYIVS